MRSMKLAILAGASICAVLAMWFMNSALQSRAVVPTPMVSPEMPVVEAPETDEILVAARSIPIGRSIEPDDLRWQAWPAEAVQDYHFTQSEKPDAIEDLEGFASRLPILDGEPISNEKVIDVEGTGVMASLLRHGMRAVAVPLSDVTGAGGFILPGDFVDVLLTRQIGVQELDPETGKVISSQDLNQTDTIMKTVRVVAIDQKLNDQGNASAVGNTATLELTPEQAELITLTRQLAKQERGFLTLSLRSFSEMVDLYGDGLDKVMPQTVLDLGEIVRKELERAEEMQAQFRAVQDERAKQLAAQRERAELEEKRLAEEHRLRALYAAEIEANASRAAAQQAASGQQVTIDTTGAAQAAPQDSTDDSVVLIRNGAPIVVHTIQQSGAEGGTQ